jgi:hypothetical protein
VRSLALGLVLGVACAATAVSYAKGSPEKCLDAITPVDGYRYFSGHDASLHNHPAMYASGSGSDAKLTVIGSGFDQSFPMSDPDAAFAAYRKLLADRGYLQTP